MRRKGFHELDETLPTKRVLADVFSRSLGFVVVLVGLDEPDETPEELAADSVDMEPFEERGCKWQDEWSCTQMWESCTTFR